MSATQGLADLNAGTSVTGVPEGAQAYALKAYGSKQEQKAVPDGFLNVGRFWGVWGMDDVKPVVATTGEVRDELADLTLKTHSESLKRRGYKVYEQPFCIVAFKGVKK